MKISYEMPDEQAGEMVAAFCQQYNYQGIIQQTDEKGNTKSMENPVSPADFAFDCVKKYIGEIMDAHLISLKEKEKQSAVEKAMETRGDVNIEIKPEK